MTSSRARSLLGRWPVRMTWVALAGVGVSIALVPRLHASGSAIVEQVEISAPILPRVSVLYPAEGANFPRASADIATLAHDAALTFDFLLGICPATHAGITIPGPGDPPTTPAQNAANFEALANCAYTDFVSKPYWIPALVDQVDICGTELGPTWHLIGEDDVNNLTETDAQALADALSTPNAGSFFGNFYFSLHVWVRGTDGSLKRGDLSPGASPRVTALPAAATSTTHYESDLGLRCIRSTVVL
jgi:hypothetical protein